MDVADQNDANPLMEKECCGVADGTGDRGEDFDDDKSVLDWPRSMVEAAMGGGRP